VKIRVEAKDHEIVDIELSGEWRAEPVDLHCLVGPTVVHYFTPEGFYDHAEPRPPSPATTGGAGEAARRIDVGPTEGTACVS
jgi:hypothetical protein